MGITADMKIVTTPRVVFMVIAGCFASYFWLMTTFYTQAEAQVALDDYLEHSKKMEERLDNHIISSSIYRVDADIHDTEDKLWLLNEQMLVPTGNTPERRQKSHEYQQRISDLQEMKNCLKTQHEGCVMKGD